MEKQPYNEINKTVTLIIISISQFLVPIMASSIIVALPSIGRELQMEAVLLGWANNAYMLAATAFLVPIGRVADIYGRKRVFTYGILIFTISTFLCGISNSSSLLILFRVFQGIGSAMGFGTSLAILTSVFPAQERGKALGVATAAVYLGLSLGPFIGGVLTYNFTWRSVFFATASLAVIVTVLVLWKLKGEWADARGEKFSFASSIHFSLTLALGMYGFSELPTVHGFVSVFLGAFGMILFFKKEARSDRPILNIKLIRENRVFSFSCLTALANYSATFAVTFLLSLYLQYNKGFSPQTAGLIMIAQTIVQAICAPIAGRISDKILPQNVASFGMGVTCLGLFHFIFLRGETSLTSIIVTLVVLGFGFGFFSTPNTNAVMGSVEKRFLTVAAGMLATMRHGGMVFSMGIVMILFAIYVGGAQITPQNYPVFLISLKVSFIIFTILCFIATFIQLVGRETEEAHKSDV